MNTNLLFPFIQLVEKKEEDESFLVKFVRLHGQVNHGTRKIEVKSDPQGFQHRENLVELAKSGTRSRLALRVRQTKASCG